MTGKERPKHEPPLADIIKVGNQNNHFILNGVICKTGELRWDMTDELDLELDSLSLQPVLQQLKIGKVKVSISTIGARQSKNKRE